MFLKIRRYLRAYPIMIDLDRGVEFTEYCPSIFREIRKIYGVENSYAMAFEQQVENRATEGGASNALFFYSKCNRYIVKSCTLSEMKQIRLKAQHLRDHFQQYPKSMITKIFGAYKLQMYACDLYFIVTNNVLHTRKNEIVSEKYDLKGSSVYRNMTPPKSGQRLRCKGCGQWFIYSTRSHLSTRNRSPRFSVRDKDTQNNPLDIDQPTCPLFVHEPDSILKDNDLRGRSKFRFPKATGEEILERLRIDAKFLSSVYCTMDYSLLVGVYKKLIESSSESTPTSTTDDCLSPSDEQDEFGNTRIQATEYVVDYSYYMGIIDYQQRYSLRKQIENWVKVHLMRQPKNELSCIDPIRYSERFVEFLEDLIL